MKQQKAIFVDDIQAGGAMIQDLAELTLVFRALRLALPQRGDIVNPQHALSADKTDVTAAIGSLRVGNQYMDQLALLCLPDGFLIEDQIRIVVQGFDDAGALLAVVPESSGVEQAEFFARIAEPDDLCRS